MYNSNFYNGGGYNLFGTAMGGGLALGGLFLVLAFLDLGLRGYALYKSARRGENVWFIALLIVNSLGILPLVYLLIHNDFSTLGSAPKKPTIKTTKSRKK